MEAGFSSGLAAALPGLATPPRVEGEIGGLGEGPRGQPPLTKIRHTIPRCRERSM